MSEVGNRDVSGRVGSGQKKMEPWSTLINDDIAITV